MRRLAFSHHSLSQTARSALRGRDHIPDRDRGVATPHIAVHVRATLRIGAAIAAIGTRLAGLLHHRRDASLRLELLIQRFVGDDLGQLGFGLLPCEAAIAHDELDPRRQPEVDILGLGLSHLQTLRHIICPQALRLAVPSLGNTLISLIKDTSLVSIVALFDLLGSLRASFSDPNWATPTTLFTGFAFTGIIYFAFCFGMSRYSLFVEHRLNAHRRN